MSKRTRQEYERRPAVKLKRYIKNHNPDYTKKRQEYAQDPKVRERRSIQNSRRRQLATLLIALLRSGKLSLNGEPLEYQLGRCVLPKECQVVTQARTDGTITTKQYEEPWEMDGPEFDRKREIDPEFLELLRKYEEGAIEIQNEPVKINRQLILQKDNDGNCERHCEKE
jgi:hypothetical protein